MSVDGRNKKLDLSDYIVLGAIITASGLIWDVVIKAAF
jgi:hypothetical protein